MAVAAPPVPVAAPPAAKKAKLRDDESLADNEISKRVFKDGIS